METEINNKLSTAKKEEIITKLQEIILKISYNELSNVKEDYQLIQNNKLIRISVLIKDFNNKVEGITSICEDGSHIILIDYDDYKLEFMENELRAMQNAYDLSNFYILESSNNITKDNPKYHAICFSKVRYNELKEIQHQCHGDYSHTKAKTTILRTTEKTSNNLIKLAKVITHSTKTRKNSFAHFCYYDMTVCSLDYPLGEWDNSKKLIKANYLT